MSRALSRLMNSETDLREVFWNPGPGQTGIHAASTGTPTPDDPTPYRVSEQPGVPARHAAQAQVTRTIRTVTLRSEIHLDGVITLSVVLSGRENDDTELHLPSEMCTILAEALPLWIGGTDAELRILGGPNADTVLVTVAPGPGLNLRMHVESLLSTDPDRSVLKRDQCSVPLQDETLLPRAVLHDLLRATRQIVQHSPQLETSQQTAGERRSTPQTVRRRLTFQRDLYALQHDVTARLGRNATLRVDHGAPWGVTERRFATDTDVIVTIHEEPGGRPDPAQEGQRVPLRGRVLEYGVPGRGQLTLSFASLDPQRPHAVNIHPELCLLLQRALTGPAPASPLGLELNLHPEEGCSAPHPWDRYGAEAGTQVNVRLDVRTHVMGVQVTAQSGESWYGTTLRSALPGLLGHVCRHYVQEDLPRWKARTSVRS